MTKYSKEHMDKLQEGRLKYLKDNDLGKEIGKCLHCGSPIERYKSVAKQGNHLYCDDVCMCSYKLAQAIKKRTNNETT